MVAYLSLPQLELSRRPLYRPPFNQVTRGGGELEGKRSPAVDQLLQARPSSSSSLTHQFQALLL